MPNPPINLTGRVFSEWTVIRRGQYRSDGAYWFCRCSCGVERDVSSRSLRKGISKSCGHLAIDTRPIEERIMEKVVAGPVPECNPALGSCLLWTGSTNPDGYGVISVRDEKGRYVSRSVHRELYSATVSLIPDGMEADHLCKVRNCCNTKHLEVVTHAENTRRSVQPPKPPKHVCPCGHALTEDNLVPDDLRRGLRRCWTCKKEQLRAGYRRRKLAAAS